MHKLIVSTIAAALTAGNIFAVEGRLVIPASGTGPGAGGSRWQTELILHNSGTRRLPLQLLFHDLSGISGTASTSIAPRSTTTLHDVVRTEFGKEAATGAIEIVAEELDIQRLTVSSRTINVSSAGEYGQEIPAFPIGSALRLGDTGVLASPADTSANRFNIGIYAIDETTVLWRLLRKDGTVGGEVEVRYPAGVQRQHNNGVNALFGRDAQNNDVIHALVKRGRAFIYGSAINQLTGDPAFVSAARTRENFPVLFLGVDLDENGSVDVRDGDGDNVLDAPIIVVTSIFPNFFKVVAADPEGSAVTYELVDAPRDAQLVDTEGTVQWYPGGDLRGTSGVLKVRVSDGTDAIVLTIPVLFR